MNVVGPRVSVVVPTLNEERTIAGKLSELRAIDYPADLIDLYVVDGGSTDDTVAILRSETFKEPRLQAIFTTLADKAAQLNVVLPRIRTPWMLVTDADARVPSDTLAKMVAAVQRDRSVGVVGTPVLPAAPHPLDACHWRVSNWLRRFEHRFGSTGLVVAPCYLVRRDLVDRFPLDAAADDVHVSCAAAAGGARQALVEADVRELRSAITTAGWFGHKVRRTLGYLREVMRFLPLVRRMPYPMAFVFIWRAIALTVVPPLLLAGLAVTIYALGWPAVMAAASAPLAAQLANGLRPGTMVSRQLSAVALPFWTLAIVNAALVAYPFYQPRASYAKEPLRAETPDASQGVGP